MGCVRNVLAVSVAAVSASALAIGTTDCASGDGLTRRVEQEVWGANQVTWVFRGQEVAADQVKLETTKQIIVSDIVTQHPELGERREFTAVEQATVTLADGSTMAEYVLCQTVEFPNVYD